MDYERFKPPAEMIEVSTKDDKDHFIEPPIKDYSHFLRGETKNRSAKRYRRSIIGIVILVLVVLGAGGYQELHHHSVLTPTHQTKKNSSSQASRAGLAMHSYMSSNFGVSLNYPRGWTVTSDTATSLTLRSPVMNLKDAAAKIIAARILIMVVPKGQLPSTLSSNDAVAVLPSQDISYNKPGASQNAKTNISFLQYSTATLSGTLDGIYLTGNGGYQKDAPILRTDIALLNPLISVTFGQCANTVCAQLQDLSISAQNWSDPSFSGPLLSILKSLSFQ